jgi:histidine triad (HIT) family protein
MTAKKKSVKPAKSLSQQDCAFCQIVQGKRQAYIVYEDTHALCILSRHPRTNGQCFVIPRQHYSCMDDMDEKTVQMLFLKAKRISEDLQKKLNARGIDLLYTCGESEYPSVNHVAIHLFPRFEKDSLNVWPKVDTTDEKD